MKILDNMKGRSVIRRTADHFGESELQVRKDMQEALDAAWATDDPAAKKLQEDLFPDGQTHVGAIHRYPGQTHQRAAGTMKLRGRKMEYRAA